MSSLILVPLIVVGLLVCWWVYLRPQRGLLLFAALAPLHYMLHIIPGGESVLAWKEGLLTFTLVAAVLRYRCAGFRITNAPWAIPFSIFFAVGVISAVATLPLSAVAGPLKISFFYGIVITLIGLLAPFDARDRDTLVTIMMVVAFGCGLFGIWQVYAGPQALIDMGFHWNSEVRYAGSFVRAISTFGQPFPFALYEMITLIIGGTIAFSDPGRLRNKIFLWLMPIYLIAMATAIVRAAFLGLLAALLYLGICHNRRVLQWLGGASVVGVVIALIFPGPILNTFFSSSSLQERGTGWNDQIMSVLSHPVGIGLGSTGSAALDVEEATSKTLSATDPYQPDNYYMKVLIELGPIGLWAFVAVLVVAFYYCKRVAEQAPHPDDHAFALAALATVPAVAAAAVVATYFEIFPLDAYFWLILVAAMSVRLRPSTSRSVSTAASITSSVD